MCVGGGHMNVCVSVCMWLCICMCVRVCAGMYVCVCVRVYMCVCLCICVGNPMPTGTLKMVGRILQPKFHGAA